MVRVIAWLALILVEGAACVVLVVLARRAAATSPRLGRGEKAFRLLLLGVVGVVAVIVSIGRLSDGRDALVVRILQALFMVLLALGAALQLGTRPRKKVLGGGSRQIGR